jgi:acetyltransferase-like isoleucine patch superfamily enzyme
MTFRKAVLFPGRLFSLGVRRLRGQCLTRKVTERGPRGRVVVDDPFIPITLILDEDAKLTLRGQLRIYSYLGSRDAVFIHLKRGSTLVVDGDFEMGGGCNIVLEPWAQLYIGGRRREEVSGMTERSRILVRKRIHIGVDFMCSWGVFVTDSDWHDVVGRPNTEETVIGDHVWLAPNCSLLKGSRIGDDSIVATGAVTHRTSFPNGSLIGGLPARILASNRSWNREEMESEDGRRGLSHILSSNVG